MPPFVSRFLAGSPVEGRSYALLPLLSPYGGFIEATVDTVATVTLSRGLVIVMTQDVITHYKI